MSLTINDLWRGLLTARHQKLLSDVLLNEAISVLQTGNDNGVLDLQHDFEDILRHRARELAEATKLWTLPIREVQNYEPVRLYNVGHDLIKKWSGNSAKIAKASSIDSKCQDLTGISRILRTLRNRNAHTHEELEDHGNASLLAGAILRLLEISEIKEAWVEDCSSLRNEAYAVLRSVAEGIDTETDPGSQTDRIIEEIHSVIMETKDRQNTISNSIDTDSEDNPKSGRTLTKNDLSPEYWTLKIQHSLDGISEQHSLELGILTDLISNVSKLDRGLNAKEKRVEYKINELERLLTEILSKERYTETRDPIHSENSSDDKPQDSRDEELDDEEFDDEIEELLGEERPKLILTPEQARQRFLGLRKLIKNSNDFSEYVENWENIFMGPIVDIILSDRVMDADEFRKNKKISKRYKEHQEIMDEQLDLFGESIWKIMREVDWPSE
jgi:hypothetical protein